MENRIDTTDNQNESKPVVREKSSIKMRIWSMACILLFAAGILFLICFLHQDGRFITPINYRDIIIYSAIAVIVISVWCLFKILTKITVANVVFLIIAGILLAAGWYIYFRYIPKYGPGDGCNIVKADPKYASMTVEPRYSTTYDGTRLIAKSNLHIANKDNPFYEWGYVLDVISDGKVIAEIGFDNATGKYEVLYELKE